MISRVADFVVVGAGSAGCIVAAELIRREAGSVLLIEAGPTAQHPLVSMPFGLVWLMGGARDWCFKSAPQAALGGRQIAIPRGRMVGGSGSINSMVWFRGRRADFDAWNLPGWRWSDVEPAFEAVETKLRPAAFDGAHPLVKSLSELFGANRDTPPSPERESAGVFRFNMEKGRRRSAADAFLEPAKRSRHLTVVTGKTVVRLGFRQGRAANVTFDGGGEAEARKGIVLSAGAIGSPAILLRSGVGPAADLARAGVDLVTDAPGVGQNLHDHPAVGLHFAGPGSGYGLTWAQAPAWAMAPLRYALLRSGRFASPTVEGGMFFNARGENSEPDMQSHVIPFMLGWQGRRFVPGAGYFMDVTLCRPRSRGAIRLTENGLSIDPALLSDTRDLEDLVAGVTRLRRILAETDLGGHDAPERFPGPDVKGDEAIAAHIRAHCGTAYHPVGTLAMGTTNEAPVSPELAVKGIANLWVADASVMPRITSANTNAPSMMIGYRAAAMIAEAA
ncbi:MAG: GMC family oxidoreductase N-terminal domain-containing protein [Paracoccaceae bacterium]|nr:GMC family oxidoreductase N-terminal domain-containing protein [Paracoccaceae bacterium]